jgi:hypothetical protein
MTIKLSDHANWESVRAAIDLEALQYIERVISRYHQDERDGNPLWHIENAVNGANQVRNLAEQVFNVDEYDHTPEYRHKIECELFFSNRIPQVVA